MLRRVWVICQTELTLLLRNRPAATLALAMPLLIGAFLAFRPPDLGAESTRLLWTWIVTTQLVTMLGFTVYITTTIAFSARRQELYLKRLRCGQARDLEIVAGLAAPPVLLALVQIGVILTMSLFGGLPPPESWWPLALAVLGGALMCSAVGVFTSGFTRGAENAQITTAPFLFVLLAGGVTVMRQAGEVSLLHLALPGGSIAELTRLAWLPGAVPVRPTLTATALLLLWIIVPLVFAVRTFRWAPRT